MKCLDHNINKYSLFVSVITNAHSMLKTNFYNSRIQILQVESVRIIYEKN